MNIFDSLFKKDQSPNNNTKGNSNGNNTQPFIVKPRGKEVGANEIEEKKVKRMGNYKSFEFSLQVYGKSIFQNLILSVNATVNGQIIPVKCKWKRVNANTDIFIKDINSFSYMPTAEDIGYIIEVEVTPLDYPNETAIGQYGPIEMDSDMKNAVELLLTNGQTQFALNVYDTINQERLPNKEMIIYLHSNMLKLVEVSFNSNTVLEECRYHLMNPVIKLNPCDSTRFVMKFFTFDHDSIDERKIDQKNKREYDLIALSKRNRELIYLIIQFFIIDEKLKNNKLFSLINYNTLPSDTKVGVTDLIGELKTLKEENKIMMNNMKYLEHINRKINEDFKNLEEDFQVTLQKINASDMQVRQDIENNLEKNNLTQVGGGNKSGSGGGQWKKKYDDLMQMHTSLSAKEKALREEIKEYKLNEEINRNLLNKKDNEIKELKNDIHQIANEKNSQTQSITILNEKNNKIQKENDKLQSDIIALKNELNLIKKGKDELSVISSELDLLKKDKDAVKYDNQNLIVQRNLLTKQKNDLAKTFEEMKNKKEAAEKNLDKRNEKYESLQLSIKAKEKIITEKVLEVEKMRQSIKDHQDKYNKLHSEYSLLKEEQSNMAKPLDTSQISITSSRYPYVKIQKDEYEEYDLLKRGQDETEAMILQLKANNDAQEIEISKLKLIIEKYESHQH